MAAAVFGRRSGHCATAALSPPPALRSRSAPSAPHDGRSPTPPAWARGDTACAAGALPALATQLRRGAPLLPPPRCTIAATPAASERRSLASASTTRVCSRCPTSTTRDFAAWDAATSGLAGAGRLEAGNSGAATTVITAHGWQCRVAPDALHFLHDDEPPTRERPESTRAALHANVVDGRSGPVRHDRRQEPTRRTLTRRKGPLQTRCGRLRAGQRATGTLPLTELPTRRRRALRVH